MDQLELDLMQIISYSGDAKSLCFEALKKIRTNKKEEGLQLLDQAEESLIQAKKVHAHLLQECALGENNAVNLLTVHAEDQMMSSETILSLIKELLFFMKKTY